jgi:hypothetical protein
MDERFGDGAALGAASCVMGQCRILARCKGFILAGNTCQSLKASSGRVEAAPVEKHAGNKAARVASVLVGLAKEAMGTWNPVDLTQASLLT